jgi:hypothetical protein
MHHVDQTTEQMVRSVLAYAENRLRMDPVPLDKGTQPAADLYKALDGVIGIAAGARHLFVGDRAQHHFRRQSSLPRLHPHRTDQGKSVIRHVDLVRLDPRHLLA